MDQLGENASLSDVSANFKDMKAENIRNALKKMWMEDLYTFCQEKLNPTSAEILVSLLKVEADFKAI